MGLSKIIIGAAYIGPFEKWGWVSTIAVIVIGIFLFWILYNLFFSKMKGSSKSAEVHEEKEHVVSVNEVKADENGIMPICKKDEDRKSDEIIAMPLSGELMEISKVPDPIFSEKMVGDGFAIRPTKGEVFSPVTGYVETVLSNKASITFSSCNGREVILHLGTNISSNSAHFISLDIKEGDHVTAGQKIGYIDLDKMIIEVSSTISPVIFPKLKDNEHVMIKEQGLVEAGMQEIVIIEIKQ